MSQICRLMTSLEATQSCFSLIHSNPGGDSRGEKKLNHQFQDQVLLSSISTLSAKISTTTELGENETRKPRKRNEISSEQLTSLKKENSTKGSTSFQKATALSALRRWSKTCRSEESFSAHTSSTRSASSSGSKRSSKSRLVLSAMERLFHQEINQ